MAITRGARARSYSVRAPWSGPISMTCSTPAGLAASAMRSRMRPLARKCWPSLVPMRDSPAINLVSDMVDGEETPAGDRLTGAHGRGEGAVEQPAAEFFHLSGRSCRARERRVVSYLALSIDCHFESDVLTGEGER